MVLGVKGKIWPPGQTDPKGTHPPPKHVFGCTERKSTLLRVSCGRDKGTKKFFKAARIQLHPYVHPIPIFGSHHILHVGRTVDVIKHARFQVNRFRDFGAPGAENDPHPLNWHIALTTTHALTTTLRFLVTGPPSRTVTLRDKRQFWSSTSDFTPLLRALPS